MLYFNTPSFKNKAKIAFNQSLSLISLATILLGGLSLFSPVVSSNALTGDLKPAAISDSNKSQVAENSKNVDSQLIIGNCAFRGDYFTNPGFAYTPKMSRQDKVVDFDWGENAPATGFKQDGFSVRWTSNCLMQAGDYNFSLIADDGARLFVDGLKVAEYWKSNSNPVQFKVNIKTSKSVKLVLEYADKKGPAKVKLTWEKVAPKPVICTDGFKAEYYNLTQDFGKEWTDFILNKKDLKTILGNKNADLTRCDPKIDFYWDYKSPDGTDNSQDPKQNPNAKIQKDFFAAKWTGNFKFVPGIYNFKVNADDALRIYLDDKLIIDNSEKVMNKENIYDIVIDGNSETTKAVRVEYIEGNTGANAKVVWDRVGDISTPTCKYITLPLDPEAETFKAIKTDTKYTYRDNSDLSLTFSKLDETVCNPTFSIKTVKASYKDKTVDAFEIKSNMTNGQFKYDLTIPNGTGGLAEVVYSEDLGKSYVSTNFFDDKKVITVKDLDHFTWFLVTGFDITSCGGIAGGENEYRVTSLGTFGTGSLRDAIICANLNTNAAGQYDKITFDVPAPYTINTGSGLIDITDPVEIDGQNISGGGKVILMTSVSTNGMSVSGTHDVTIKNLSFLGGISALGSFIGILADNVNNLNILGNNIGLGENNNVGPFSFAGIRIQGNSNNINIGDGTSTGRNVISSNKTGIQLAGIASSYPTNVNIKGNYIGTTVNGLSVITGGLRNVGIQIVTADDVNITDNVISGMINNAIESRGSNNLQIKNNKIGVNVNGLNNLGNSTGIILASNTSTNTVINTQIDSNIIGNSASNAISILSGVDGVKITNNKIGVDAGGNAISNAVGINLATNPSPIQGQADVLNVQIGDVGKGNIIANNTAFGVRIQKNLASGFGKTEQNPVRHNLMFNNAKAIDLIDGNQNIQAPTISTAKLVGTEIEIEGCAVTGTTVDFYNNSTINAATNPEGQYPFSIVATGVSTLACPAGFSPYLHKINATETTQFGTVTLKNGNFLVATNTDANKNTSEFSPAVQITSPVADIAVTNITLSNPNPLPGEVVTATVDIQNLGPDTASNIDLAIQLGAGLIASLADLNYVSNTLGGTMTSTTFNIPTMSSGTTGQLIFTFKVDPASPSPISNSITVLYTKSNSVDNNNTNDLKTATVSIISLICLVDTIPDGFGNCIAPKICDHGGNIDANGNCPLTQTIHTGWACPSGWFSIGGNNCRLVQPNKSYSCPQGGILQGTNCVATATSPVNNHNIQFGSSNNGECAVYRTIIFNGICYHESSQMVHGTSATIVGGKCPYGDIIRLNYGDRRITCGSIIVKGGGMNHGFDILDYKGIYGNYSYPASQSCPGGWGDYGGPNCYLDQANATPVYSNIDATYPAICTPNNPAQDATYSLDKTQCKV